MKKKSLNQLIMDYLKARKKKFVHKGELGRVAVLNWGYENENLGRRCREMYNAGLIDKIYEDGKVLYRFKKDFAKSKLIK